MENDAVVEIEIGGLWHLLLDDFHKLLAKPSASHIFHRPDDHGSNNKTGQITCYKTRTFSFTTDRLGKAPNRRDRIGGNVAYAKMLTHLQIKLQLPSAGGR
jgi:hypothetical protein